MMPRVELDDLRRFFDAMALHLGWRGEVLGANKISGGLGAPRNLARCLGEWRQRLTSETTHRLFGRALVAVLEEELTNHVGINADSAVLARQQPRRRLRTRSPAWDSPSSAITDVTYNSWVTLASAPASVMTIPP